MYSTIREITNGVAQFIGSIFSLAIAILVIVAIWRLYERKGYPGWYLFIPIYNLYIMCEIAHVSPWILLLLLIPGVNAFIGLYLCYKVVQAYGRGFLFAVGVVFLPVIFIPLLAFT
ncbi:MAG: DUF5684 domain-containing protein [Clostridia bacterium]|nr:DUF5684 domain-containing protein [Clostridia bacterium]